MTQERINEGLVIITKARKNKRNIFQSLLNNGFTNTEASEIISPLRSTPEKTDSKIEFKSNDTEGLLQSSGSIRTLEELLIAAKVDLTIWRVKTYEVTKWDMARKDVNKDLVYKNGRVEGIAKDSGKANVKELFRVAVKLERIKAIDTTKELLEYFKNELNSNINTLKWNELDEIPANPEKKYCLEINIADLHIGKLSWGEETGGENYDSNEAVRLFKYAVGDLIEKAPINLVERILLPIGNDLFNSDGSDESTTAGTPQVEDSRWQNTFRKGCKVIQETIAGLAIEIPVDVVICVGNHDMERSFYLGEYLAAFFKGHPNVSINNSPTLRKYYRYGQTLLGFTHGDKEIKKNLPLLMATEQKDEWAATTYKEWHTGHLHAELDDEIMGVKIRTLPSLCSADSWHASKGYVGQTRGAKAFLYHFDKGLEAQYYFNL